MRGAIATILLLVSVVLPLTANGVTIEDSDEAVSMYARGERLMRQGDWFGASQLFEEMLGRFPDSKNADLFLFNRSKADYYFGNLDRALGGFTHFSESYPTSPYAAHARYFTGNIQYQKGQLDEALESYIAAYGGSDDSRLTTMASEAIVSLLESAREVNVGVADFSGVPKEKRCPLFRAIARPLVQKDRVNVANRLLQECGETIDAGSSGSRGENTSRRRTDLEIAMVLPFSGELQSFSDELYNGGVIAAEFYRQETGRELELSTEDSKGDPVTAGRLLRGLVKTNTDAVIGPLTSEEAQVASAAINCDDIPLIIPAATQAGLTSLNGSSFQLSPNIELQAVQMADYAINDLQADSAVIITSTAPDHLIMARAFADRFRQYGGTVVAVQYYRARDTDFGPYIKDIKDMLIGTPPDSSFYISPHDDTLHVDALPAAVDVLYMPGSAEQLRLLLPQLQFYNIQATYLGSDGWNDDAIYKLGDNITRFALFSSPFIQLSHGEEYVRFAAAFNSRYGRPPQRLAALGYDAVRIVSLARQQGDGSRRSLVEHLRNIRNFDGAAARVTFGKHDENIEMPIYRIEGGQPVLITPTGNDAEVKPEQP